MAIDIERDNIDFSCNTIDDLILADIRLDAIVKEIPNYQYEDACGNNAMEWLFDKHDAIKTELKRRMGTWNKSQIKKLKENKLNISIDEIHERINRFNELGKEQRSLEGDSGSS